MTGSKLLLTIPEAAELLSVGRSKVYELLARGELESVNIGRARRVPHDALACYVQRLRSAQELHSMDSECRMRGEPSERRDDELVAGTPPLSAAYTVERGRDRARAVQASLLSHGCTGTEVEATLDRTQPTTWRPCSVSTTSSSPRPRP